MPLANLDLGPYLRDKISDAAPVAKGEEMPVDEASLAQLMSMGFPKAKCVKALNATGNSGPDMAMNWLFEHMEDPVEEETSDVPQDMIQLLVDAGFSEEQSKEALQATNLDIERAFDYILSHPTQPKSVKPVQQEEAPSSTLYDLTAFISHKGPSIHCGHYVTYRKEVDGRWVLCNDDRLTYLDDGKVAQAASQAYIFLYTRHH